MFATQGPQERLWTRAEAAEYLGVSHRWMESTGLQLGIPQLRIGGLVRYQSSAVKQGASEQIG